VAGRVTGDLAAADRAAGLGRVAVDPAAVGLVAPGQVAFDPAVADHQVATIAAVAHVGTAKSPHTTGHARREIGAHLIVRVPVATGPLSTARRSTGHVPLATVRLPTAHGQPATDHNSTARLVSSGHLLIDPVAILVHRKGAAGNQTDHHAIDRGKTARGVTPDRHTTAPAAVPAVHTRIVRADHALMAGASGPAARAGRRDRTTRGQRGQQTSTRVSSSVRVMS